MTGSHTHPRVNCRLLPAGKTAGRLQDRPLEARRRLREAEIRERAECNRKSGETPAIANNGRTNPVTAVNGPARGTRWLPGEGVSGQ